MATSSRRISTIATIATAALLVRTPPVHAQPEDTAAALSLFEEGKKLTAEGNYREACPKLLASYKLAQKLGTLLNLGDCYEKAGKTASAWARFTEARRMADHAGQQERAEYAAAHAAALAAKLSRLTITVAAGAPSGLEIRRDGTIVDPATFGSAVPIDPGEHTIEARAPNMKAWTSTVEVIGEGQERAIEVPVLESAPEATPIPRPPVVVPAEDPTIGTTQRTVGIVLGGIGVASVGVGLVGGLIANSEYADSNQNGGCVDDLCTQRGFEQRRSASTIAAASTTFFVGGLVLVGTGVVVYVTAPRAKPSPATSVSVGPSSIVLGRTW